MTRRVRRRRRADAVHLAQACHRHSPLPGARATVRYVTTVSMTIMTSVHHYRTTGRGCTPCYLPIQVHGHACPGALTSNALSGSWAICTTLRHISRHQLALGQLPAAALPHCALDSKCWRASRRPCISCMAPVAAQAGALLCAIAYHCITLVLSIPVLLVRRLQLSCRSRVPADWKQATFFVGEVRHTRKRPAPHSFRCCSRAGAVARASAVTRSVHNVCNALICKRQYDSSAIEQCGANGSRDVFALRYPVRVALVNLVTPPAWFRQQQRHHLTATEAQRLSGCQGTLRISSHGMA